MHFIREVGNPFPLFWRNNQDNLITKNNFKMSFPLYFKTCITDSNCALLWLRDSFDWHWTFDYDVIIKQWLMQSLDVHRTIDIKRGLIIFEPVLSSVLTWGNHQEVFSTFLLMSLHSDTKQPKNKQWTYNNWNNWTKAPDG